MNRTCRYCLENNSNLISPCNCTGTIKYVHETCLYNWLKIKYNDLVFNEPFIATCELCKKNYNISIEYYSPFEISDNKKILLLLLSLLFSVIYMIIIYGSYIYCLEIYKTDCESIKKYDSIMIITIYSILNLIYIQGFLEKYISKIRIKLL